MRRFIKPKPLLGIDVSQNSVRILELSKNKKGCIIETCVLVPLLQNQPDDINNITATLKLALKNHRSKTQSAIIDLSYSAIIRKTITIPTSMTSQEIGEFITLNLEQYIGIPKTQISFDYQITEKNRINTTIDLIAVRKERVEKCQTILAAVNLKPKIIDIDAFALARAINVLYQPTHPIAAINLDYGTILTCVIDNDKVLYAHEEFIENEKLKTQLIAYILNHLQLCITTSHHLPTQLFLSGEYAISIDHENIAAQAQLPTTIVNPLIHATLAPSLNHATTIVPAMAIAFGLALRSFDHA